MTDPTRVTERQNTYLQFLQDGPRTTRDFALEFMVSAVNVGKILNKLRNAGLVQSSKAPGTPGNVHHYTLTAPYHMLNLIIGNNAKGDPITDEEVLYAAILRNAGLLGQRLKDQYRKRYPNRVPKAIDNIVTIARTKGLWGRRLCR